MEENAIEHPTALEEKWEYHEFEVILGISVTSSESKDWGGAFIGILEGKAKWTSLSSLEYFWKVCV